MTPDFEIIKILNQQFAAARARNSSYSLRAFARKLGVPASGISEVLRGKRRITRKMATRMLERLQVDPQQTQLLTRELKDNYRVTDTREKTDIEFLQLTADQFQVICEWQHFAILSLAETQDFNWDPKSIAGRLRISRQKAVEALARLERLRLIEPSDRKNEFRLTGIQLATTQDVRDLSIQKAHYENLELARRSLESDEVTDRDFSFITMAVDPKLLAQAKKRIIKFRRELCAFLEAGEKKEVYQLSIQLFPLTDLKNRGQS